MGIFGGELPFPSYPNSDDDHTYMIILRGICEYLGPLGVYLPLYGVVDVAAKADASINRAQIPHEGREGSIDIVLVDRDPRAAHDMPIEAEEAGAATRKSGFVL